jgi:hypothetical protein
LEGQPQYRIQDPGFRIQARGLMVLPWPLEQEQDSGFSQDSGARIQGSGKCDHGGCLVSGERIGFSQDSGFRIQGSAIMVVAWLLGKG